MKTIEWNGKLLSFGDVKSPLGAFDSGEWRKLWEESRPNWKQVHGDCAVRITESRQTAGECDALWTDRENLPVGVVTADCVPILLAHRSGPWIGAIHSGWRGTKLRILEKTLQRIWLEAPASAHPKEWQVWIGPHISVDSYEVSPELALAFKDEFGSEVVQGRNLDLLKCQLHQLHALGIHSIQVESDCTFKNQDFASYRRSAGGPDSKLRQYSVIVLR
jgi:YfiH family protein